MSKTLEHDLIDMGTIRIADEVIGIIAGLAASEVSGVVGMSGASLSDILGRKSPSKGVKVVVGESEAAIDLYIVVEYGMRLNEVAEAVQDNVRRAVESMTGLAVVEVNVHVQGVGVLDPTNL